MKQPTLLLATLFILFILTALFMATLPTTIETTTTDGGAVTLGIELLHIMLAALAGGATVGTAMLIGIRYLLTQFLKRVRELIESEPYPDDQPYPDDR